MTSWNAYFASVPDPRRPGGRLKHLLGEILGLALCAMLCGADDFVEMALFGQQREAFLKERLGFIFPGGVPSHDTITRVFGLLNPQTLEQCLLAWVRAWQVSQEQNSQEQNSQEQNSPATRHLCVDGKVARGTWEAHSNVCALTSVSVFATELRLVLCSGRLPGQGGENLLAPRLLELLTLEGALVTGDAAYCQKPLAALIHEQAGDYVFVLKSNHRHLYEQVQTLFESRLEASELETSELEASELEASELEASELGHGRREERRVESVGVAELGLSEAVVEPWPGLQSVARVERVRTFTSGQNAGKSQRRVWFYLSSLPADQELLATTIRSHWKIENQVHWVLDVVFGEDRCRTRKDHAPYNLALLRRICLNLLRQNQGKNSLKSTRKAVTWNQDLLCNILSTPLDLS